MPSAGELYMLLGITGQVVMIIAFSMWIWFMWKGRNNGGGGGRYWSNRR